MYICPNCKSKNIGKIGTHQFYCWECFIEFGVKKKQMELYQVEEDGSLSSLDDIFTPEELARDQYVYGDV